MMKEIICKLNEKGFEAQETTLTKNGVEKHAVTIGKGTIKPVIYIDEMLDANLSADEIVSEIINIYKNSPALKIDTNTILSWDYAKENLQLCLQRRTSENILKRPFLDMEMYIRVKLDDEKSYKVKPGMFEISEREIFDIAFNSIKENATVEDMMEIMAEMAGVSVEEMIAMQGENLPMIVVSNKTRLNGASTICSTEILREIADRYNADLAILPSSIHECILYPLSTTTDFCELDAMVREVNESEVSPEEVLSDHAYRFLREENRIVY